ncbi:MAG: VWA domain-containing protein [Nitrospirae bacterium]|nr:VWA domain-containing protein [Nitrospirota bacterium]
MISFVWPYMFALVVAPWIVRWIAPRGDSPISESALRIPFFDEVTQLKSSGLRQSAPFTKSLLFWMAFGVWCVLIVAASRPQWIGDPIALPITGRDLLLAVDVSGSMEIPDFSLEGEKTNRLEVVKAVAGQFVERRTGDRVGLILFGSQAYLQTPLTFDRKTVQTMLEESEIGIAGKETAIGDAIGLAVKRFRAQPQEHKVLLLLTDGANTAGAVDPLQAAKLAADEGIRIYAIGVGADYLEVPSLLGTRVVNPSRDLDEGVLQKIADLTGGIYFRAKDTQGLSKIYDQVDQFEPIVRDTEFFRPIAELYMWPLGAAFLLSLIMAGWLLQGWGMRVGTQAVSGDARAVPFAEMKSS